MVSHLYGISDEVLEEVYYEIFLPNAYKKGGPHQNLLSEGQALCFPVLVSSSLQNSRSSFFELGEFDADIDAYVGSTCSWWGQIS